MAKSVKKKAKQPVKKPLDKKTISKEITKQKLLDAAMDIFARHGFDGATTKEISEHAGVNEALITRYFKGKKGLFETLILNYYANKTRLTEDFVPGDDLLEDLKILFSVVINEYTQNPKFVRLLLPPMILDKNLKQQIRKTIEIPNPTLKRLFTHYQKKKVIRADIEFQVFQELVIYMSSSMINDQFILHLCTLPREMMTEQVAIMIEAYLTRPSKAGKKKS